MPNRLLLLGIRFDPLTAELISFLSLDQLRLEPVWTGLSCCSAALSPQQ
jgi:hypothetical protein